MHSTPRLRGRRLLLPLDACARVHLGTGAFRTFSCAEQCLAPSFSVRQIVADAIGFPWEPARGDCGESAWPKPPSVACAGLTKQGNRRPAARAKPRTRGVRVDRAVRRHLLVLSSGLLFPVRDYRSNLRMSSSCFVSTASIRFCCCSEVAIALSVRACCESATRPCIEYPVVSIFASDIPGRLTTKVTGDPASAKPCQGASVLTAGLGFGDGSN